MSKDDIKEKLTEAIENIRNHMATMTEKWDDFPFVVVAVTLEPETNNPRIVGVQNINFDADTKIKDIVKSMGKCVAVMNSLTYMMADIMKPTLEAMTDDDTFPIEIIMAAIYETCLETLERKEKA